MHAVNLLPREAFVAERSRLNLAVLGGAATPLIALALVITGYNSAHEQVGSDIAQLSVLNAQVAQLAPAKLQEEARIQQADAVSDELVGERTARLTALEQAMTTGAPVNTFLAQFGRVLPPNVWLTTLLYMPLSAGGTETPTFSIEGYTYTQGAVAQLLAHLELLPTLSDVTLSSAVATTVGSTTVVQFTIDATPLPPPVTTIPTPTVPGTTTPGTTPGTTTPTTTTTSSGTAETSAP